MRLSWSGHAHVLCLILACLASLHAQSDLASVTGVVTDPGQAVMPGVTVTLRNTETNIARSMQTNADGYYTLTNIPPGTYDLTAEKPGFRTYRQAGIVLETGEELRSDVKLSIGSVNETVLVTAEVAVLSGSWNNQPLRPAPDPGENIPSDGARLLHRSCGSTDPALVAQRLRTGEQAMLESGQGR